MHRLMFLFAFVLSIATISIAQNVDLLANYDQRSYNDVWGYEAPDGRYYAIGGAFSGASVLDVTDAAGGTINEVAYFEGPASTWRDIKVYKHYAYLVNDAGEGQLMIIDLSGAPDNISLVSQDAIGNFHNLYIDTTTALMYLANASGSGETIIMSLEDPENPVYVNEFGTETHDVFVRDGLAFTAEGRKRTVGIYDVSNPQSVSEVTKLPIPDPGYVHNTWTNSNNTVLVTTEETSYKTIKIWDISDLENIELLSEHIGPSFLAHNAHIEGDFVYVSHYSSGLVVIDITDPERSGIVGLYDTFPAHDTPGFSGNWGVYPHSTSGNIYLSDGSTGMHVVKFNGQRIHYFSGIMENAANQESIAGGRIDVGETQQVFYSDFDGSYGFGYGLSDSVFFTAGAFGYVPMEFKKEIISGKDENLTISLTPSPLSDLTGIVRNENSEPIANARVRVTVTSNYLAENQTYETYSDENGEYVFEDLPISNGLSATYIDFVVDQAYPYSSYSQNSVEVLDQAETVVDVELQQAGVLVVNLDPANDYTSFIETSLAELGKTMVVSDPSNGLESLSTADFSLVKENYMIVISGDAQSNFVTRAFLDTLRAYVENGGNVIMSGQNLAQYLSANEQDYLEEWLGISYVDNSGLKMLGGLPGTSIGESINRLGLLETESAGNQISPDIMMTLDSSSTIPVMKYWGSESEYGAFGIGFGEGQGRVFFAGFGLEGVSTGSGAFTNRTGLIELVTDWFEGPLTDIRNARPRAARSFELQQNYPNPFNPSTTIRYTLPQTSEVSLAIYTITGKKVTQLQSGTKEAGTHSVRFDASSLASGIYFYVLEAGAFKATKRMVLIR